MTLTRLFSIACITAGASIAWFVLGATLHLRTRESVARMDAEVRQVWGPGLEQPHLKLITDGADGSGKSEAMLPASSKVDVKVAYKPKKRGLMWHRTYYVEFSARYEISNPSAGARNVRIQLAMPTTTTSYDNFSFQLGDSKGTDIAPHNGMVETVALLPAGATVPLVVRYDARGLDSWAYTFSPGSRVKNFTLTAHTNFKEANIPVGASSPTAEEVQEEVNAETLTWSYPDTLDARNIAVEMPTLLNAGPVIQRITFFAPVSLLLFFGVLVVLGMIRGVNLHPMTYAFLAAGFFTFHLMLAYLGDVMSLHAAFLVAASVSLLLVCGYLHAAVGRLLSVPAVIAQLAYMVAFSYSFFFDGFTGLTLTLTAVATLALLMIATAKVNWESVFENSGLQWNRKVAA